MFGKLLAGLTLAGLLMGAMATGAFAQTPGSTRHRGEAKDTFHGIVTGVSDSQLVVRDRDRESKTFVRTEDTQVFEGRNDPASWSDIKEGNHVRVAFEERDGKLIAKRVHIGAARVEGTVQRVDGNRILIRTKAGEDITVTVNDQTRYFERTGKYERKPGSLSDIKAGQRLMAAGRRDPNEGFDARLIVYRSR